MAKRNNQRHPTSGATGGMRCAFPPYKLPATTSYKLDGARPATRRPNLTMP